MSTVWVSRSRPLHQAAAAIAAAVVGGVLVFALWGRAGEDDNMLAALGLGVLLLALGVAGIAVTGLQTTRIDPARGMAVVEDRTLLGTKKRVVMLGRVSSVGIGFLGKVTTFTRSYHLVLTMDDGSTQALFDPGRFYPGAGDRETVEQWRARLESAIAEAKARETQRGAHATVSEDAGRPNTETR